VVERLDLVPVKGKTGGDKIVSEWATLSRKYLLPWGKRMFGFISDMAVTKIAKENLLQENEKIQDLSLLIT
jgi:hypothetical protein